MRQSQIKILLLVCLCLGLVLSCTSNVRTDKNPVLPRLFPARIDPSSGFEANVLTSPILDLSRSEPAVLTAFSDGRIVAQDAKSGAILWQTKVPAPEGHTIALKATPVRVRDRLVAAYQTFLEHKRQSHFVAVIDLNTGQLAHNFPVIELTAEKMTADGSASVTFNSRWAMSSSDLIHAKRPGQEWGYVYISFGNAADIQPFHGWLFEIDLDNWLKKGAGHAASATLLTTPETHCPEEGKTGSRDMICGGGIWTPAGPHVVETDSGFELIVPTGNGQFDFDRKDYAGTLMRVGPGLEFDPGCDVKLCKNFDIAREPNTTDRACMASCANLFIPRLMPDDPPLRPASGVCDNKSFWECLMWNDYDLGANGPVHITLSNGTSVLVQPGKEGALYLLDARRLGIQYDRRQIVPVCGTPSDECLHDWGGMVVTQPVVSEIDGDPVVIVATFMPDHSHAAGLVAYKIILSDGSPQLQPFWQAPAPDTVEALQRFRWHPSRVALAPFGASGELHAWIVDIGEPVGEPGTLLGVRVKDGAITNRTELLGTGRQLSKPLIHDGIIYEPVNNDDGTRSWLEAYQIGE